MINLTITLVAAPADLSPQTYARQIGRGADFVAGVEQIKNESDGIWGWCNARVVAQYRFGDQLVEGIAEVSCCSYRNAADFIINSQQFDTMVAEAIADLKKSLATANISSMSTNTMLVNELIAIIELYSKVSDGLAYNASIACAQLRKAAERPDMLSRIARRCWDSCMRVPEVVSTMPKQVKDRALDIIGKLEQQCG